MQNEEKTVMVSVCCGDDYQIFDNLPICKNCNKQCEIEPMSIGHAFATIDAALFMIGQYFKERPVSKRTPIEMLIDQATGYKPKTSVPVEDQKWLIECVESIVKAKSVLGHDSSAEKKLLNQLHTILKSCQES